MSYNRPVDGEDEPITPTGDSGTPFGARNVIEIDEFRVRFGRTKRYDKPCEHEKLVYCPSEKRVWCEDCESTVNSFDAFHRMVDIWGDAFRKVEQQKTELKEQAKKQLISLAAKAMDRAFRKRDTAPCCPHCHEGLLPEDVLNIERGRTVSKELLRRKRKAEVEKDE